MHSGSEGLGEAASAAAGLVTQGLFAQGLVAQGPGGLPGGLLGAILPFALIFGLFYLMILMPERKRNAELKRMLDALKKNDRVVTRGGIVATVVNVTSDSDEVTLRIDEGSNARLRVLRSAIVQVLEAGGKASESSGSGASSPRSE